MLSCHPWFWFFILLNIFALYIIVMILHIFFFFVPLLKLYKISIENDSKMLTFQEVPLFEKQNMISNNPHLLTIYVSTFLKSSTDESLYPLSPLPQKTDANNFRRVSFFEKVLFWKLAFFSPCICFNSPTSHIFINHLHLLSDLRRKCYIKSSIC